MRLIRTNFYVLLCILPLFCIATLTPKSKRKQVETKAETAKIGPQNYTVFDRNLIVENPTAKDIILNYQAYFENTKKHNFKGIVLGYVTPWNNHGYDVAKLFANKFTHISPVWLQVLRKGDNVFEIAGTHDIDNKWMHAVRKAGAERGVKILPRVLFESWSGEDYLAIFTVDLEQKALVKALTDACKKFNFDGVVVEIWLNFGGRIRTARIITLIQRIAISMKIYGFEVILVVPPKRKEADFDSTHYEKLYKYVAGFSLMTYDFSNLQRPGPNSPVHWIEENILHIAPQAGKRDKILMGLNFYGMDYTPMGGGPVVGRDFIKKLQNYKGKLQFDTTSEENFMEILDEDGRHIIFYPTLQSVHRRLKLAEELGTGLSIWELGQGLDYFYDLL